MVQWLTDFGDQSVVLPVFCVVLLCFCLARWWRGAFAWFVAILGTLVVMLLLKLGMGACGWEIGTDRLDSPSGHTASATALYGSLLAVMWRRGCMAAVLVGAGLIASVFAVSRLILHDHTVPEVLVGAIVGMAAVALFRLLAGPATRGLRAGPIATVIVLVMAFVHGERMPAERQVHSFSTARLRPWLCPGSR